MCSNANGLVVAMLLCRYHRIVHLHVLSISNPQCPYRHSDKARVSTQVCRQWMEKKCSNQRCPYKHPAGEGKEAPVERGRLS